MSSSVFSCDERIDVAFIPFMPATAQDKVEIRVQIRTEVKGALLDTVILVDGEPIHSAANVSVKDFYFFNCFNYYTVGNHTLNIRFRESGYEEFEETSLDFRIEEKRLPILSGGFIMLGPPNDRNACASFCAATKKMTDLDWEDYVDQMAVLGIKCIIITTTVQLNTMEGENTAHYPSRLYPRSDITANDPIRAILQAAERNGQYVFIGLGHTYRGALPNTKEVMDEIYSLYGDCPAFYGWYESEEVNIRQNRHEIWDRWRDLRKHALSLAPVKPFIVSPYADGEELYAETGGVHPEFLKRLASGDAEFDIIAPQDMVGHTVEGGRLSVAESSEMYRHLSIACNAAQKHLWANCEAFDFDESFMLVPRFNGGGMSGENGYIQQIKAVYPYSEKVTTFMLNGFFSPRDFLPMIGGPRAVEQCEGYRAYMLSVKK